jgi:hypothetical protein
VKKFRDWEVGEPNHSQGTGKFPCLLQFFHSFRGRGYFQWFSGVVPFMVNLKKIPGFPPASG